MIKRKVINILLGLTVLLLLVNLAVERLTIKEPPKTEPGITVTQVEDRLYKAVNMHGILPEWIKIRNKKDPDQDSIKHYFRIEIPSDLSQPLFLYDLRSKMPDTLDVVTDELDKHGDSVIKVFNGSVQLLHVVLKYSDEIKRNYCKFSFLIETDQDVDEVLYQRIANNPFPFSIIITPSFANKEVVSLVDGLDKDYVVLLNDEETDRLFQLTGISQTRRLKSAINEIVRNFGANKYYLIDDKSSIYQSTSLNFIRDEFKGLNVSLHKLSDTVDLREKELEEIASILKFYSSSMTGEDHILFRIKLEKFLALEDEIRIYKKKGHPVVKAVTLLSSSDN